ncbi:MAG: hypothetical protein ACO1OC_06625 [Tuberibacillus sp.]
MVEKWLTFVLTLVISFGCFLQSSGVVAFLTLAMAFILRFILSFLSDKWLRLPFRLTDYAGNLITTPSVPDGLYGSIGVSVVLLVMMLAAGITIFKKKELI